MQEQERRDLGAVAVAREAVAGAIKVCDTIKKYTEKKNKYQFSVGIHLPKPIKDAVSRL